MIPRLDPGRPWCKAGAAETAIRQWEVCEIEMTARGVLVAPYGPPDGGAPYARVRFISDLR
jgi:hypothetical protein